jgi:hypothetical protein
VGRCEQLDVALADADERLLDAVGGDVLAVRYLGAERAGVVADRLLEVVDGEADVIDALQLHGPDRRGHS